MKPVAFDALPLRKNGPHGNAWGLFSRTDQLGMLNHLTPETTREAAKKKKSSTESVYPPTGF